MKQSSGISIEIANSSLSTADRELTADINARAAAAGYTPFIKAASKEPDDIGEYAGMLEELSDTTRRGLLSSKKCRSDAGRCKGPVKFVSGGENYSLCRHSMQFQGLAASDIPAVWRLIEAESLYATQTKEGD